MSRLGAGERVVTKSELRKAWAFGGPRAARAFGTRGLISGVVAVRTPSLIWGTYDLLLLCMPFPVTVAAGVANVNPPNLRWPLALALDGLARADPSR